MEALDDEEIRDFAAQLWLGDCGYGDEEEEQSDADDVDDTASSESDQEPSPPNSGRSRFTHLRPSHIRT